MFTFPSTSNSGRPTAQPPSALFSASSAAAATASSLPFAQALARQSTGMLEASEFNESLIANRYKGEASARATTTTDQLSAIQRGAAEELRRQRELAAHTCWRQWPKVHYYGSLSGLRLSVLTSATADVIAASAAASSSRSVTHGQGLPKRMGSTAGPSASSSAVVDPSLFELSTLPNNSQLVSDLAGIGRSTGGSRVLRPSISPLLGPSASSSKAAQFYRRHCCFYQFGPDLPSTQLEVGESGGTASTAAGPIGSGGRSNQLTASTATAAASGGASAIASSAAGVPSAIVSPSSGYTAVAAPQFNITDTLSYIRYVDAFVSAFEVFGAIHKGYKERLSSPTQQQQYNDEQSLYFEDFALKSVLPPNRSESERDCALNQCPRPINDHTMTLVCTAHPRHKNFSLHLFCEESGGGSNGGGAASLPTSRMSAMLVSDSAAFQREVAAQLKRVLAEAEWFGGALFVQELPPNQAQSASGGAASAISPVLALVDVILNMNLLCEVAAPPTAAAAAPSRGVTGASSAPPAAPPVLSPKGQCTIVTSFPFSGGQQKDVLMRALEPSATTIPYRRTYSSLVDQGEAAAFGAATSSIGGAAAAFSPPFTAPLPVPLPATRHSFLVGASPSGGTVITPRCLRALACLLVDVCGLTSFEMDGMVAAPLAVGLGMATKSGGAEESSNATATDADKDEKAVATTTTTAKGLAALTAAASTGPEGRRGGGVGGGHSALSSLDAGAGGHAIVSYRLFPTRLCGEEWVSVEEQQAQGIEDDGSGLARECMFYPSRIRYRRLVDGGSAANDPAVGSKRPRAEFEGAASAPFLCGNFAIDNTVLWFLDDDEEDEEGEEGDGY